MIREWARTLLASSASVGLTGAFAPVVIAASAVDELWGDPVLRAWARNLLRVGGVRVEIHGLEKVPHRTCVLVCNHQSHFDPLVMLAHLPGHIRYVAKAELFKIPLFGQAMTAVGNLPVDRDGGKGDRAVMEKVIETVRARTSIFFFAEGTRSPDGVLGPFKKGAAVLALQAGVPVVPMALAGTQDILPKGSVFIQRGRPVAVCVGEPISTEGMTLEDRDELTARARRAVVALHADAQARISNL